MHASAFELLAPRVSVPPFPAGQEAFERVETIGFAYGQRHAIELTQRPILRDTIGPMLDSGEHCPTHLRARKSPCRAGTEAPVVPPMGQRRNARAPDVAVTCTQPIGSTFDDPVIIVEVMSPNNVEETWQSIQSLAGLVSLKEIMVVQSTTVGVELYRRDEQGAWPREPETAGVGGEVRLTSIDLILTVADIYEGTSLA